MNSGRRTRCSGAGRARNKNAGTNPASSESGVAKELKAQDRLVSIRNKTRVGAGSSALVGLLSVRLCGSVVNSLINRRLFKTLEKNKPIEQLNNASRFTRKIISSQDFFAANIDLCAFCSTVQSFNGVR